jgi:hypothetical protein
MSSVPSLLFCLFRHDTYGDPSVLNSVRALTRAELGKLYAMISCICSNPNAVQEQQNDMEKCRQKYAKKALAKGLNLDLDSDDKSCKLRRRMNHELQPMSYRFLHLSAAQTILRADPDFWRLLEVYV